MTPPHSGAQWKCDRMWHMERGPKTLKFVWRNIWTALKLTFTQRASIILHRFFKFCRQPIDSRTNLLFPQIFELILSFIYIFFLFWGLCFQMALHSDKCFLFKIDKIKRQYCVMVIFEIISSLLLILSSKHE